MTPPDRAVFLDKDGTLIVDVPYNVDPARSWFVGDILNDVEAGRRAGCRTVLLDVGHETEWLPGPDRTPDFTARDLAEAATLILQADAAMHPAGARA